MNDVEKKSFLARETTRREFLKLTGKGIGGTIVSMSILSLFGCTEDAPVAALAFALPTGLLISDPSRCTGCQRCETTCSLLQEGKVSSYISKIRVAENYNFGTNGPKLDFWSKDGHYGNFMMTPETCKQCREPFCGRACPVGAISADPKNNNARTVDKEKCIGCGACADACPWHFPRLDPETNKSSKCVACGICATVCPTGALKVIPWEDVKYTMNRNGYRLA